MKGIHLTNILRERNFQLTNQESHLDLLNNKLKLKTENLDQYTSRNKINKVNSVCQATIGFVMAGVGACVTGWHAYQAMYSNNENDKEDNMLLIATAGIIDIGVGLRFGITAVSNYKEEKSKILIEKNNTACEILELDLEIKRANKQHDTISQHDIIIEPEMMPTNGNSATRL